jgi:hypothetical protein
MLRRENCAADPGFGHSGWASSLFTSDDAQFLLLDLVLKSVSDNTSQMTQTLSDSWICRNPPAWVIHLNAQHLKEGELPQGGTIRMKFFVLFDLLLQTNDLVVIGETPVA